jgi:hypothetical protein
MVMRPVAVDSPYYAERYLVSGNYVYCAFAPIGSVTTDPVWQAFRYDTTGPIVKTWADGNENFDNLANDLAGLSYS